MADDFDQNYDGPNWVDNAPLPLQNPDATPADIAAYRLKKSVIHKERLPIQGREPGPPQYLMEPDLFEAQGGIELPSNMVHVS